MISFKKYSSVHRSKPYIPHLYHIWDHNSCDIQYFPVLCKEQKSLLFKIKKLVYNGRLMAVVGAVNKQLCETIL